MFSGHVQLGGDPGVDPGLARRDYISQLVWERLRIPQEGLESIAGERDDWNTLLSLLLL